jgi:hypothetical protein
VTTLIEPHPRRPVPMEGREQLLLSGRARRPRLGPPADGQDPGRDPPPRHLLRVQPRRARRYGRHQPGRAGSPFRPAACARQQPDEGVVGASARRIAQALRRGDERRSPHRCTGRERPRAGRAGKISAGNLDEEVDAPAQAQQSVSDQSTSPTRSPPSPSAATRPDRTPPAPPPWAGPAPRGPGPGRPLRGTARPGEQGPGPQASRGQPTCPVSSTISAPTGKLAANHRATFRRTAA